MKRLLMFTSMLALAGGCATHPDNAAYYRSDNDNTASGASEAVVTTTAGNAAGGPTGVQPNEKGYQAATITPPITTDATPGADTTVVTDPASGDPDSRFLQNAALDAQAQINLGQMIVQKSSNQDLKNLGQRLIVDNNRIYQQLSQIAQRKGMTVPSQPDARQQEMINRLSSRTDFDHSAARDAARVSDREAKMYQKASDHAQDADVKSFAQQNLPTIQQDQAQAKQVVSTTTGAETDNTLAPQ
jgi:putative membrane protein